MQLQLAPVGVRERRERLMVARTGTDQSAVVHERSLASRLTTTATPPTLEIRRRVSPADRVRTRERQIRVLNGGGSNAASRSRSSARHRSRRGPTSRGRPEADDPPRPSRRALATRSGHSNRDRAIRVDSTTWTPRAPGRRHDTNRDSSSGPGGHANPSSTPAHSRPEPSRWVRLEFAASEQAARTCVRRLADGPVGAGHRSSSRDGRQLLRHWTDTSVRDHLPARVRGFPTATAGTAFPAIPQRPRLASVLTVAAR